MRKITFFMTAVLMSAFINLTAQSVSNFDDLSLQPDTFWNGSDLSGGFYNQDVYFVNYYDTSWGGFWNGGFAYSNMTDSVTAGYTNEYSVMTGHAYSGSNFAVVNPGSFNTTYVKLPSTGQVAGFFVTNSTYAYISMRDGDAYAKKFGGSTGDDPDWFKLTVDGYSNGSFTDSAEIYLADYRFTDNAQDYILKEWTWFELTGLGDVDSLVFRLNSSDVGQYGMNTPAFFCMDDFQYNPLYAESFDIHPDVKVYPNPARDIVFVNSSLPVNKVGVFTLDGEMVISETNLSQVLQLDISGMPSGIYFLKIQTDNCQIIKKIIKE